MKERHTFKGNILIVDDTPANLRLLSNMLTEQGYKVRAVINGAMALMAANTAPPDLILLDISMPGMSGYEVCVELKADPETCDIPVIFISALDEVQGKVKAFNVGGVDYVTKPFQFEEVLARVETHLALCNLRRQLQETNQELELKLEELAHTNAQLEARNAELDAFAHTVAHDLKNPVTSLIGFTSLLERWMPNAGDEKYKNYVRLITQNGRIMNNIIDELLLLASVRELSDIEMDVLDMPSIIRDAQERLSYMVQKRRAEITVSSQWPTALGYAPWVEEIWVNYISNAVKYGGRPDDDVPPCVELGAAVVAPSTNSSALKPESPGPGVARFWVRDNGPGLTHEAQARLFTPFERLHQVRVKGHGLGLSIVRRIVEKLGGQVGVESQVGQGSTFYFTLPSVIAEGG